MVKDAESNKEADKKKRDAVDARNQADTLLHSTEKNLKEHGSKVLMLIRRLLKMHPQICEMHLKELI